MEYPTAHDNNAPIAVMYLTHYQPKSFEGARLFDHLPQHRHNLSRVLVMQIYYHRKSLLSMQKISTLLGSYDYLSLPPDEPYISRITLLFPFLYTFLKTEEQNLSNYILYVLMLFCLFNSQFYFADIVTIGTIISSIDTPPCWNVSL